MISPYICYTVSFASVMLVYLLGWSDLYPKLSISLLVFLLITFIVHIGCHFLLKPIAFRKLERQIFPAVGVTIFIYSLWIIEFIYEGGVGIPLLKILFHLPYNYRLFGVPTLHVFVVTFSSFFTVYLFHLYVSNRSKLLLILYLVNLGAALLIYSRAMLFFNLTGSAIVYLMSLNKISLKKVSIIAVSIIPLFFVFGVLGSLRVSREAHEPYNNENFMKTGAASADFRQSVVPKEFFWAYIYISSPLANLEHNIDSHPNRTVSLQNMFWAGVNECLPDFITKRIHQIKGTQPTRDWTIGYSFNVSTVYSRAYSYSGWGGIILVGVFMISIPFLYLKILDRNSDFFVTGWAILCTIFFFASYDNTIRFTGLSFQLVYPLILAVYERVVNKTT